MPELPEVETIRQQLEEKIASKKILKVEVKTPKILNLKAEIFKRNLIGEKFQGVWRRAKLLILKLTSGAYLMIHLKLTGRLLFLEEKDADSRFAHIIFYLSGGTKLIFDDMRKFGYVKFVRNESEFKKILEKENFGPEPLSREFTYGMFKKILAKKQKSPIKPLLMDQTFLAGVGNVYAQEACFYAKINPKRKVKSLSEKENEALFDGLRHVLVHALKYKGSSVDTYVDIYGRPGKFVPFLKVYDRAGKPCLRDGAKIKVIKMAGRGTYFCPKCQK